LFLTLLFFFFLKKGFYPASKAERAGPKKLKRASTKKQQAEAETGQPASVD
jgi:hypothetical protein